ncbi:mercury(II) reductase [Dongia sp.]|jgi:mercury(II) reductase|uniref:mercury(II) reductase n=1 Tax=Dongia sp. TaxID=1977262 RepID=UPI0035ADCD91
MNFCTTSERRRHFDLAVIGAGSAGFSAAITAAAQGAHVALIGYGLIGGTCVNIGCVPSKRLIRAAEALQHTRAASRFNGIQGHADLKDWQALIRQKDELVADLRQAKYIDLLPAYDTISYLEGEARLVEGGVAINGQRIWADKIVITTGARPAIPSIPGIDSVPYLTSTSALDLDALPRSMIVLGGGYIGVELAQVFARVGVQVTILCRSRLLPQAEPEIGSALSNYLTNEGLVIISGAQYRGVRQTEQGVALDLIREGRDETMEAERLLVATGRQPNTAGLGLEDFGILLGTRGGIVVDDHMRTTREGTYAAGDVTGQDQFVYMAAHGARIAAENALSGDARRYDRTGMPSVVFTDPQIASAGLTEAEARAQGRHVLTTILPLNQVPRALAAGDTRGLIKLVAERDSGKLLGAHILAPEGCDSIQTAVLAIRQGMTFRQLADTIFPYLTTVEGLKLAALSFEKDVKTLSCCAN